MPSLTIGLSLAAMRPPGRAGSWSSTAWQASDVGTGLTLGPAAVLDFSAKRYALSDGWWEMPAYAATQASTGKPKAPSAVLDFSSDRYAR